MSTATPCADRQLAPKRLTDARSKLVARHWKRARGLAKLQRKRLPGLELDWDSCATDALCDAAFRFQRERKVKFWTFASRRIKYAFIDMIRASRPKGYRKSQDLEAIPVVHAIDFSYAVGNQDASFAARIESGEDPVGWELDSLDTVDRLARHLPRQAREIVRLYYAHGLTLKQAGARIGVSLSRAAWLHDDALQRLREILRPEAYGRRAS